MKGYRVLQWQVQQYAVISQNADGRLGRSPVDAESLLPTLSETRKVRYMQFGIVASVGSV